LKNSQIPEKVLIVCLGNICRSPAAEYLLRHYANQSKYQKIRGIYFESAGLTGGSGMMYHHSRKYLENKGIDPSSFRSKGLNSSLLEQFDLILIMEEYMRESVQNIEKHPINKAIKYQNQSLSNKIMTLKEAVGEKGDVEDPYGLHKKNYNKLMKKLNILCKKLIDKWEKKVSKKV